MSIAIRSKRRQQLIASVPCYLHELKGMEHRTELRPWLYYKMPYLFRLADFPLRVELEVTNECNFGCPYCPRPVRNSNRSLGFMTFDIFDRVVNEVAQHSATMKIGGLGEPALHPDLPKMMRLLKDRNVSVLLYTNGTLFERHSPDVILSWRLKLLIVSIDGTDEHSFERLRVGGKYFPTVENVRSFREARSRAGLNKYPEIEIRHVIMPGETPEQLSKFRRDWLNGLGDAVKFNYLLPPDQRHRQEVTNRPPCRDIRREMYVRWDGRVPLCAVNSKEWLGNVRQTTLSELWQHARLREVRALHERRQLEQLPFCRSCAFR